MSIWENIEDAFSGNDGGSDFLGNALTMGVGPASFTSLFNRGPSDQEKAKQQLAESKASSRAAIEEGKKSGLSRAEQLYGMSPNEIGTSTQDIIRRRRENLDAVDPVSIRAINRKNQMIREAKSQGASADQLSQLERQANFDISQREYASQQDSLNRYQSLIGNILGGTSSLEMGHAGLQLSGEVPYTPYQQKGILGSGLGPNTETVICTELYRQGYLDKETMRKDANYGLLVRVNKPHVYHGYIYLATPVVSLMRRSKVFTKLISIPGIAWARNMSGDYNLFGKIISHFGEKLCGFVGKIIKPSRRDRYAKI